MPGSLSTSTLQQEDDCGQTNEQPSTSQRSTTGDGSKVLCESPRRPAPPSWGNGEGKGDAESEVAAAVVKVNSAGVCIRPCPSCLLFFFQVPNNGLTRKNETCRFAWVLLIWATHSRVSFLHLAAVSLLFAWSFDLRTASNPLPLVIMGRSVKRYSSVQFSPENQCMHIAET